MFFLRSTIITTNYWTGKAFSLEAIDAQLFEPAEAVLTWDKIKKNEALSIRIRENLRIIENAFGNDVTEQLTLLYRKELSYGKETNARIFNKQPRSRRPHR